VVIVGGGLAGLTLALQLVKERPGIRVRVLERRRHPVPVAAHKVGESTVEIGAHYFAQVLGLREHLDREHLRKFGFRFFFSDARRDIDACTELGASRYLSVPTYQIDRGIFENHLGHAARAAGIDFVDDATVTAIDLADDAATPHAVAWRRDGGDGMQSHVDRCRWVVDAGGRAGLLKRKLGLDEPSGHAAGSVWFRVAHRIAVDAWSDDASWSGRVTAPERWLSTNHLCGDGYWLWLIPLASGSHSVGIVFDPDRQPLEQFDTFDKAMDWIRTHQPRLFDELDPVRHTLQDFAFFKRFSYGCKRLYDARHRWALTGEAGRFLDPFYSPGSDFIAIGNTYVTQLVADDLAGRDIRGQAHIYDSAMRSFHESMLPIYQGQYGLFADAQVMPVKVIWDYTYYWSVLAPLFFHDRLTDVALLARATRPMSECRRLNEEMQAYFRRWSHENADKRGDAVMLDQCRLAWFADLNRQLVQPHDAAAVLAVLEEAARRLARLAHEVADQASARHPALKAMPPLIDASRPSRHDTPRGSAGQNLLAAL
jgi:flavin-dependent dehydrogenase